MQTEQKLWKKAWKESVSQGRKKFLADNPNKHPWKNRKAKSAPCENVKKFLQNRGINFVEEYSPIPGRNFSVDIAFPDLKYGIEINGNQHYNRDGTLKEYYSTRHNIFIEHGWTLLELHYSLCFNDELLDKVITLRHTADYTSFILQHLEDKKNAKAKKNGRTRKEFLEERRQYFAAKWELKIQEIRNSDIDFNKFGWVQKVAEVLAISPQHVNRWMKIHLPNIYSTAFKRRTWTKSNGDVV